MTKDRQYPQDDETVLLGREGRRPADEALTDQVASPRVEQLEERMIYAARQRPAEAFSISLNSLVAAASELLSEVVRLKHSSSAEDLIQLNRHLTSGVKQFEARAMSDGLDNGVVSTARYLLCTVVDEAVVTTSWGNKSEWSKISLLSSFHNETSGGEKVFKLLDQLSKNPVRNLPMLELIYLCLSLGFEGKYRVQARGVLELEGIRDALYRQIRQLRGDVPRELSPQWQGLGDQRRSLVHIVPWWMVALFTLVCLVVMYSAFTWVLGEQRETVLQPYQPLDPNVVQPQP